MAFRLMLLTAALSLSALPASAQDVGGKWTGSVEGDEITFDFMVDGNNLSGTVTDELLGVLPISGGMIDGSEISFKAVTEGGDVTLAYNGVLEGDAIVFQVSFEDGGPPGAEGFELIANRTE